jgi:hypothetical protein
MRFLAIMFLSLLVVGPAMAALPSSNNAAPTQSDTQNFGGINCLQRVPCPDTWAATGGMPSSTSLAENANSCISQYFGLTSTGDGFFDKDYGLDSSNCLSNIPGSVKQTGKANATPHCCLAKLRDQTCSFSCELMVR